MKNVFFLFLVCLVQLIAYSSGYGQKKNNTFSFHLTGKIKADTGTVLLLPVGGKEFDPNITNNYTAKINQGRFTFEGKLAYPTGFLIAFFPNYVSSPFILETGVQNIICNIDSVREIPMIDNRSMRELKTTPVNFFSSLTYSKERRTLLLNYIRQHPDSYVALWETVRQIDFGYMPILDSIYNEFSTSIKTNHTGKKIAQHLKSSKATGIGQVFPTLAVLDTNQKSVLIPFQSVSKYTLIDFWYARCTACIADFPKLKEVFESYKDKGFTIAGISIDKQVDIELWKSTILKRDLTWKQYLDLAGKLTNDELLINSFPSNFLLDDKGIIVKRNIRPSELSKFLSEKL